ncbi:hypothetical protein cce_3997 [Crocosphaera subtropica ATCC 51142]|uniref:Uncharacterized protein n=1 Tax=Crocosphaera subtropica (strain ATCC 51142 / BH68) TaxID=43989 RepID=B1WQP3_CROS5|nr:hypothetical protein cce_3997 [Crocosphaera subtropica ATCC 51142]
MGRLFSILTIFRDFLFKFSELVETNWENQSLDL